MVKVTNQTQAGIEPDDQAPPTGAPVPGEDTAAPAQRRGLLAGTVVVALLLAFTGGLVTMRLLAREPGEGSVDAGFARDMQTHHGQAVSMSLLIRDRSTDPELRTGALDIALTQQGQNGRMSGWLDHWRLEQNSTEAPMSWMNRADGHDAGHPGSGSNSADENGLMPGMASPDQIAQLRAATGRDAEILYLQLMIAHHQGGIPMARAAARDAQLPEVRHLAQAVIDGQTSEILAFRDVLTRRGVATG